jgi:predicted anti-sigma-YlaC factor YlaD
MKCKKVRRKLGAYLDGELKEKEKLEVKEHLRQCSECRRQGQLLTKVNFSLKEREPIPPPANFQEIIWERINAEEKVRGLKPALAELRKTTTIAVATVLLAAGVITGVLVGNFILPQRPQSQGETYVSSIELENLQGFPSGSLSQVYFDLVSGEGVE